MSDMDQTRVIGTVSDRTMVAPAGGATLQMPAGGMDPLRTQMGGTATCPICASTTPLPATYCGDCGYLLSSTPVENVVLPPEEAPAAELVDVTDGRRHRLRPGVNTLGRQGTDIVVTDGTISRNHAKITVEDGVVTIEDMGSTNGTKIGDLRLQANQPTVAAHGTPMRFGNWRVILEVAGGAPLAGNADRTIAVTSGDRTIVGMPLEAEAIVAPAEAALPVEKATPEESSAVGPLVAILHRIEGVAKDIPISEGTISVGRKSTNTIALPQDAYISGRHAEIVTDNRGTTLTDLGSTNGTVVNGQRLAPNEPQLLLEGDQIQLGQSKFKFILVEPAEGEVAPLPPLHTGMEGIEPPPVETASSEHPAAALMPELASHLSEEAPRQDA